MKAELTSQVKTMLDAIQAGNDNSLDELPVPYMSECLTFPEGAGHAALKLLVEKAERGEELNPLEALGANLLHKFACFGDWAPEPAEPVWVTSRHKGNLTGTYTTDLPLEVFTKGLTLEVSPEGVEDFFRFDAPSKNKGNFRFAYTGFRLLSTTPMNQEEGLSLQQHRLVFEVDFEVDRESSSDLNAILEGIAARVVHRTQPLPRTLRKLENITTL
jgi:hypothetical protein